MIEIHTDNGITKIFTKTTDENVINQVKNVAKSPLGENANIRVMPDCHVGTGCTIGTTMKITDKVCPNLVGVDIGCIDCDTEFLSQNGWKKISDWKQGDQVLQYNKITDSAEFQTPINYIMKKCKSFWWLHTKYGLDQRISDEHKILAWIGVKNRGYNMVDYNAIEFVSKHNSLKKGISGGVKTTFNLSQQGLKYTDDEIRIIVMICADGHIRNHNRVELHFTKQRKINRAKYLLNLNKTPFKESINKDGTTVIYIEKKNFYTKNLSEFYKANCRQLQILADECKYWDGTITDKSKIIYSTTNKTNADVMQFAFAVSGIRCGIQEKYYKNKNWNTRYEVYTTNNSIVRFPENKKIKKVKSIDGYKYCFTMPSGYFVIRRNNKISITGNCGVDLIRTNAVFEDRFAELDNVIRAYVPYGMSIHGNEVIKEDYFKNLLCWDKLPNSTKAVALRSLGTLGGGNHFIEAYENGHISVHSGSRNIGYKVAEYYQKLAVDKCGKKLKEEFIDKLRLVQPSERQKYISQCKKEGLCVDKELCWLEVDDMKSYLHDIDVMQKFAYDNRINILATISKNMSIDIQEVVATSIHNYIDTQDMFLRKGAISAKVGERVVIPLNMRDGILVGFGKGNEDWNLSAPHGAGRLYSRSKAKEVFTVGEYEESMNGIYTTCVSQSTLDEAPFAYKDYKEIRDAIEPTVDVQYRLKPIYNFKA